MRLRLERPTATTASGVAAAVAAKAGDNGAFAACTVGSANAGADVEACTSTARLRFC